MGRGGDRGICIKIFFFLNIYNICRVNFKLISRILILEELIFFIFREYYFNKFNKVKLK